MSIPLAQLVNAWHARTYNAARAELMRNHKPEFDRILERIRAEDPRPGNGKTSSGKGGDDD